MVNNMVTGHKDSAYITSFILVILAGVIWAFGVVVVRFVVDADQYRFQYLTYRGMATALVLLIYLFVRHGLGFYRFFFKIGISGLLGACGLAIAMIAFIFAVTITSVAVTLFMLATMPFLAAIMSFFLLGEKPGKHALIAMVVSFTGTLVMIYNDGIDGTIIGALLGFLAAFSFALFTVTLRWRPETPKFSTVIFAGLICAASSFVIQGASLKTLLIPDINILLSLLHGAIVGTGMILYSLGARLLAASDVALLSLTEVIGGVFLVALPIFGINEIPDTTEIIGGLIMTAAIIYYGINIRQKDKVPLPVP